MSNQGAFVWYELLTPDPAAAAGFYTKVLGWGTQAFASPGAPETAGMAPYTIWTHHGTGFGGCMQLPADAIAGGAHAHWLGYVYADDVDATHAAALRSGGRSMVAPRDIPQVGRFAVVQDPGGAYLAPFKPFPRQNAPDAGPPPGIVAWRELGTTDAHAALGFYGGLFGWQETGRHEMGDAGAYLLFGRPGAAPMGGIFATKGSPAWLYYFDVSDLDATLARVREHHGQVQLEPMDVPGGGRIANCLDPQGAAFALHRAPAP